MAKKDIRWIQRLSNFRKALEKLQDGAGRFDEDMSDLEKEGLIQRFEYTFELAWKVLQDFFAYQGHVDVKGPKAVLQQALRDGFIQKEKQWRKMKEAREVTSHHYDEDEANEIVTKIAKEYVGLLTDLLRALDKELKKELKS